MEQTSANNVLHKELIPKIHTELIHLNIKKTKQDKGAHSKHSYST